MKNKCITVGITGGIAAFKICSLVSSLKKKGNDVHVLMTKEALEFVTPLTLQTLSGNRVITDMFSTDFEPDVHHISLAKMTDVFVIAPATANIIAKIAHGIADDMLTSTFLACQAEKLIVPAMNTGMLENPVTRDNLETCRRYGMHILDSASGYLACGDTGKGRMPEPSVIMDAIEAIASKDRYLTGKKILVTAGPTQEALDPVRYLTNHSSGKMGYELAKAARNAGAEVTLVAGRTALADPVGVNVVPIVSAADLAEAVLSRSDEMDAVIMAAAVADYTPVTVDDQKIKKSEGQFAVELKRTTDVLKALGEKKKEGQVLIGFAMETQNLLENAAKKLEAKNADYIVANSIADEGAGFAVDTNKVTILSKDGENSLGLLSKEETAEKILAFCLGKEK
ncbi:MAG: bifunctional phosphopantothenoylcysteine decarboxylase/phosphopantothenate--cysteine ligase CoaBC [Solobacterium sp.]|nr:bifunctional phosphopantothenoylcysteine decarboxylase/phosphopantothenate--cysteine ligase CoaBC [Solobacterium sp.]MBQ9823507.1 bifunctional phosphopantothenoylcysteine decarboxylase/phosphopantothenate--cysteine ligase CoaBC [Solobacterium sp.]